MVYVRGGMLWGIRGGERGGHVVVILLPHTVVILIVSTIMINTGPQGVKELRVTPLVASPHPLISVRCRCIA